MEQLCIDLKEKKECHKDILGETIPRRKASPKTLYVWCFLTLAKSKIQLQWHKQRVNGMEKVTEVGEAKSEGPFKPL